MASRITVEEGEGSNIIEEGSDTIDFSEADGIVAHAHADDPNETGFSNFYDFASGLDT